MELVGLFEEMAREVEAADPVVAKVEQSVEQTHEQLVRGNEELVVAKKHAWNTRKNKWICLGIVVVLLIIIGTVVGVRVAASRNNQPA